MSMLQLYFHSLRPWHYVPSKLNKILSAFWCLTLAGIHLLAAAEGELIIEQLGRHLPPSAIWGAQILH